MNLQPLFDVKARLEAAAMAGAGLLGEDFRLQRAAEGLKPLAAASPVFGKIDAGLQKLLAAPVGERGGLLLDVLALVDAVVYTQGTSGIQGELEPLPLRKGICLPLSYCQLHPLLDALTGTGGGRMSQIQDAWENHPEFFRDYRVQPALVAGLGESYAELAELNMEILKSQGPEALPLLQQDFDPAGKKEMARRAEVISALAGAEITPWLREMLPNAKKDVRAALIVALGEDPGNIPLLLDLSKTERGGSRDAVLKALARLDGEEVREFWVAETAKKPERVEFLKDSKTDWASDLAAAAFRALLEGLLAADGQVNREKLLALNQCRAAVLGKSSPAMLDCWRWIDEQLPALSKVKRDSEQRHVDLGNGMPDWLLDSMLEAGPGPLCGLSRELWEKHQKETAPYLPNALLAALLTRPAAEVYEEFAPHVEHADSRVRRDAFRRLTWNREAGIYQTFDGISFRRSRQFPLAEPLDPRWYDLLTRLPGMEEPLRWLLRPEVPEIRDKVAAYLFNIIRSGGTFIQEDIRFLRRCGWTDWKGFLDRKVKKDGSLTTWAAIQYLNETSLTDLEKAAELRSLAAIVQEQSAVSKRPRWPAQAILHQLAIWEAELKESK